MTQPLLPHYLNAEHAQRRCVEYIRLATSERPASIADICARTGLTERAVKQIVERERQRGAAICSRRSQPCGYWLATQASDLEDSARVLVAQARKMLRAASRLVGKHRLREMLGQLAIELDREAA